MPYQDTTGPEGFGPMSGRGMGPCVNGAVRPRGYGRRGYGLGQGRGMQMGFCPRYFDAYSEPANELEMLKADQKVLKEDLEAVEKRLKDLKNSK